MDKLEEFDYLKPLYAQLKRLEIGKFLCTKEFQLLCLEWKVDALWEDCKREVQKKKGYLIIDRNVNYDEFEEAYYILISQIYLDYPFEYFEIFVLRTLGHFAKNSLNVIDFKAIYRCWELFEESDIAKINELKQSVKKENKRKVGNITVSNKNQDTIKTIEQENSRKIFIVHGHNAALKESVARLLMKLKFVPIILHEQASQGLTVIEKIEQYSDVEFAIVLLTADDFGRVKNGIDKPRARQNAILEWGYFTGKLGRKKVIMIYENEVELPSDLEGLVYILHDLAGAWKQTLIVELKGAGFVVDANLI